MTLATFYESQLAVGCRPPTGRPDGFAKAAVVWVAIQFVVSNYSPAANRT
jgi:hypothetical protein